GSFDMITTASGLGQVTAVAYSDDYGWSNPMGVTLEVATPIVSITSVTYGSQKNRTVTISGTVLAPDPAGLPANLGGVLGGSAVTNSAGGFTYTGNASGAGTVTAQTTDIWGQQSNVATAYVNGIIPVIANFQVTKNSYNQWVASGTIVGGNV